MDLVIFIKKIKVIIKNSVYFIKEIVVQCCIENIEEFLLVKRDVFLIFLLKGNLSSFEAWIEEPITLKK